MRIKGDLSVEAMWSKQADTRNKDMTSFKNKITNRKRKTSPGKSNNNSQSQVDNSASEQNGGVNNNQSKKNQQKTASGKSKTHRGRRKNNDANNIVSPSPNVPAKSVQDYSATKTTNANEHHINDIMKLIDKDLEKTDVILRNINNSSCDFNIKRHSESSLKRYSDSFIIESSPDIPIKHFHESIEKAPPVLQRAVSGFFVLDQARKARRFSDIFRSSAMKFSTSTENLKALCNKQEHKVIVTDNKLTKLTKNDFNQKSSPKTQVVKNVNEKASKNKSNASKLEKQKSLDHEQTNNNNSYLKRVKSKIYKSKSADSNTVPAKNVVKPESVTNKKYKPKKLMEIANRIPEEDSISPSPTGLRKSLTQFDFRLIRQSSNLERARPKTSESLKPAASTANIDETDAAVSIPEKPLLVKAKSSSAINLNLLRSRRNKIIDQSSFKMSNIKDVQDEFEFIAFGGLSSKIPTTGSCNKLDMVQKQPTWLHVNKGEVKTGQPVSRSGSDRRPDAVREEAQRHHQEMAGSMDASSHDVHPDKDETATPDSSVSLPATGSKRKTGSSINRSESVKEQSEKRKQRRNISDPSHNMSGDVDLEHHPQVLSNTDSGSSSNSSISCNGRLSESPSNSVDTVQLGHPHVGSDFDSDMEVETEPLNWQELVPEDELRSLPPHEKKRQDVIHELFHTEASHVRSLKVLYKIFYKKLHESQLLKQEELNLIFPNIKEMLDIHTDFNKEMRRRRKEVPVVKEIGDILTSRFCGPQGEHFQRAAATCFKRQQLALEFIVDRRKKDQKFEAILKECEKKRQCRRLQFQAILPAEMQRLSKYPLLFERLISSVENIKDGEQHQELDMLHQAHHKSKEILDFANEAARDAHNHASLEKIQNHLDTTNFREKADQGMVNEFCDITKHRLILEGDMQLRRPNKAPVVVRILLLEEAVVILHKEGDRFLLKFFQSGSPAQPQPLSPIIKINTLIVRKNAAFKNSLYLVNISTNNSQMYDLSAEDDSKRDMWYKHITDAKEAYDRRDCRKDYSDNETVQELPVAGEVPSARADTVGGESENSDRDTPTRTDSEEVPGGDDADVQRTSEPEGDGTESPDLIAGGGAQPRRVTAEDWPLVQPSQVSIEVPPVHTAESMLTPLEQIRRKDAEVQQALADKEELVADLLSIPRDQFHHIADMASMDTSTGRDLKEYVLAALYQVSQLQKLVNESLNVTERELITAKGGKHPVCASQMPSLDERLTEPSIPAHNVRDIATSLNDHLTTLLSEVKQVEDERTMLRKELHKMRERLHEQVNLHSPTPDVDCCDDLTMAVPAESAPVDVEHCDLENPQHNQEENKKDS